MDFCELFEKGFKELGFEKEYMTIDDITKWNGCYIKDFKTYTIEAVYDFSFGIILKGYSNVEFLSKYGIQCIITNNDIDSYVWFYINYYRMDRLDDYKKYVADMIQNHITNPLEDRIYLEK